MHDYLLFVAGVNAGAWSVFALVVLGRRHGRRKG